uniref:Uncharacterized protein n=1 Tax=Myoviridae sp. ctPuP5 TaxID=2823543 RepID=A0A8S5LA50_9CAUD|nr:MAG TPA: hypothetical protein [Myoviridae sp. ctPuP5]
MCLMTKLSEPLIATHDIPCYKVLNMRPSCMCVNEANRMEYISPYQHQHYYIDSLNYASLHRPAIQHLENDKGELIYFIREGFLHCYTKEGVLSLEDEEFAYCFYTPYLFDCFIPKGSKYYISENGKEICSPKLYVTGKGMQLNNNLKNTKKLWVLSL